jgi:fluoride exporter
MNVLLIALGGSIGAVARYGLTGVVQRFTTPYFPFGTFVVNIAGCFAFGVLAGVAEHRFALGPEARAFLLIGVLGGFTTFSSFGYETLQLLRDAEFMRASLNVVGQVVIGVCVMWLGFVLTRIP